MRTLRWSSALSRFARPSVLVYIPNVDADCPGVVVSVMRWIAAAVVTACMHPLAVAAWRISPRCGTRVFISWAGLLRGIFRVRLEVEDRNRGRYPGTGHVFVALNQRSLSEAFAVHAATPVPVFLFTNVEFALLPVGWAMWLTGSVVVVRQWQRQRRRALARAIAKVRAGGSVYISIEGRRGVPGQRLPFKRGAALLAIESGAPLVPVVFDGAERVWPHGEWRVRPGTIRVTLLDAMSTQAMTPADEPRVTQSLARMADAHGVR